MIDAGPFSLAGSHFVIAGASEGIGRATAILLGRLGAQLTLIDVQPCDLPASEIVGQQADVTTHLVDVSDRAAVEAAISGIGNLTGLVNCAAICPWDDWNDDDWDDKLERVIAVNLKGAINLCRATFAALHGRGGSIVLVSSLAGRNGGLIAGPHYVATKGGINALAKWLAKRGAPDGIRVNAVAPASVRTSMIESQTVDLGRIPLGRLAEPEEIAAPIAFLCCAASSYMTGCVLDVNGGVYIAT